MYDVSNPFGDLRYQKGPILPDRFHSNTRDGLLGPSTTYNLIRRQAIQMVSLKLRRPVLVRAFFVL
jgi:hypothetical protein|uniref:Uncharacterized protein n=1 Tax=Paenarthrobacter aurescens TaxID=43663 RepID=Q6SK00_PAEAU|nr:hypothetical protein [Paenarthrobacter aurescens]